MVPGVKVRRRYMIYMETAHSPKMNGFFKDPKKFER